MPDSVTIEITFDLELTTDPLGATLSVSVEDALSAASQQKFLDRTQRTLVGAQDNLVFQAIQQAHEQLTAYGSEHDYYVESIIESFAGVDVDRSPSRIDVSWHWTHEAAAFFEFGTSDHTVDGDSLLVFEFDPQKYPYLDKMFSDNTAFLPQTNPSGLPEGRWVRDSLTWFRREVGQ